MSTNGCQQRSEQERERERENCVAQVWHCLSLQFECPKLDCTVTPGPITVVRSSIKHEWLWTKQNSTLEQILTM